MKLKRFITKRPKRTRLKGRCDKLWSKVIRIIGHCEICGSEEFLVAHHLLSRRFLAYRWELWNGICLCAGCHIFNLECSAHTSYLPFIEWIRMNKPEEYALWEQESKNPILHTTLTIDDYESIYIELEEAYKERAGVFYRSNHSINDPFLEKAVCEEYVKNSASSARSVGRKFNICSHTVAKFLENAGIEQRKKSDICKAIWNKFSKEEENKVVTEYKEDTEVSISKLARKWKVCNKTIRDILIKNHIQIRNKFKPKEE